MSTSQQPGIRAPRRVNIAAMERKGLRVIPGTNKEYIEQAFDDMQTKRGTIGTDSSEQFSSDRNWWSTAQPSAKRESQHSKEKHHA